MRVLVLTNMYPPHAYGGYEQSCKDVVERWRRAGHEVLVLTSCVRVAGEAEPTRAERSEVWRDLRLYWDDHVVLDPAPITRLSWERHNEACLAHAIRVLDPDVVSAWAMGAMSLGMLTLLGRRGLPVVCVICDEWPVYGPVMDAWMRALAPRPRVARVIRLLTGLSTTPPPLDTLGPSCFVSEHLRGTCRGQSAWDFPDSTVVYSGIDHGDFPLTSREREWRWRLLYVGRIDPRKGIDTAVRALGECPRGATLEVVGRGDDGYLAELHSLAEELGLSGRVEFSACPRSELADRYSKADALVFPAVWEEPFGLVPVEAMACGTPVVATLVGGASEFLADGRNCLAFPPGDPRALARALVRLEGDPRLRRTLVSAGLQTAGELSVDRLAEDLEQWHRAAAEGGARPRPRTIGGGLPAHG